MSKQAPLVVSGLLFGFFALAHIYRLMFGVAVTFNTVIVPLWVSIVIIVVAGLLSIWMFSAAFNKA